LKRRQASLSIKENETNAQELYKEQKRKEKNNQTNCPKMISVNTRENDQNKQMQRTS